MQPYLNRSGNSGVVAFKIQRDFIIVRFRGGELYVYESERVGRDHIDEMKRLAVAGRKLSTYISRNRDVWSGAVGYDPAIHGDLN